MRHLITVEDVFAVQGRGTLLAPEILLGERGTYLLELELRRPDGTRERCTAKAHLPMTNPPQRDPKHVVMLPLTKSLVPIGTEVWLVEEPA